MLIFLAGVLLVMIPVIWRRPVVALYVLVGAAVTIEIFPLGFADSLTDQLPFFLNLNNTASLPISITPAEVVMVVALAGWLTGSAARRSLALPAKRILAAYAAFLATVLIAEVHGLASGGDFNISLWELRPQIYGFVLFLLASSLIRERRHLLWLAGIFFAGACVKTGVGYHRYFVTLHGDLGDGEVILAHEDSYFLALFLVATVAAAIWHRRRRVVVPLLLATPFVLIVLLENRRRAAMLALWVAMIVIIVLGVRYESAVRKKVVIAAAIAGILLGGFVSSYWNAQYGIAAQVVRPVHALTGETDERDQNSDLYRDNENANLKLSYQANPVIGMGFGLPMLVVFPLADISKAYPLWQYIPHNTLLWVAMRMGMLGMVTFWALIGVVLLEGLRQIARQDDPLIRGVAAFALTAIVAELVVGYGDLQLENYRNMIFCGSMIGLVGALPRLRTS